MPFDFNNNPVRLYGIFPMTPFPIEVSIYSFCQMACGYCFSNLNRTAFDKTLNLENSTPKLMRHLANALADEHSPLGFFLREKYPICFSNATDPFQREETRYRSSETFMRWAAIEGIPLFVQTKGNVLFQEFERYKQYLVPGKDVVYISITHAQDSTRKVIEPGALDIESRWELARMLTDHGIPVIAACNPYLKEWVPSMDEYCDRCVRAGVRGIWLEGLHFNKSQLSVLPNFYEKYKSKANLLPIFHVQRLKEWYRATGERGLDFFPTPQWDTYFGCRAKHPECCDPKWVGGKVFDATFRILQSMVRQSQAAGGKKVVLSWTEIEMYLCLTGVQNPILDIALFWEPYYTGKMKADKPAWKAALGNQANFFRILRYWYNHPWENAAFLWFSPSIQSPFDYERDCYISDEDSDDLYCIYNPTKKASDSHRLDRRELTDFVWWSPFEAAGVPKEEADAFLGST